MRECLPILSDRFLARLAVSAAVFVLGLGVVFQQVTGAVEGREEFGAGIVFTQLPLEAGSEPARLVRRLPDGSLQALSEGFASARDPDISFDGQRILFAGQKRASDHWQVYEMAADGSGVRRVTNVPMDCRGPIYQSTLYVLTSDKPWYQISFVGSTRERYPNLYSAKLDGTAVRRITHNPHGDMDPFLMQDGRILFASRQGNRLEGAEAERVALFGVNLDGTDYAIFSGDEGARLKRMPCVTTGRLAVFVESEKPERDGAGTLAAVTLRRNLHSHRTLTAASDGLFHSPSPLPNGEILVSRRPADGSGTHGIYRFDPATGKTVLIYDDPERHDIQAKLLIPRPEPDGRSSVVNEQDPTGILYCLNVYATDLENRDWMPPGSVKRLRVIEGLPWARTAAGGPPPLPGTRMLGEIDVEDDGSFNIRVPANIPIQLQLLDAGGLALRTCRWIWVRNKEPRGCIGCHEDGELTPENRMVKAMRKPSIALTLEPERRRTVRFGRDVAPVLSAKCHNGACHAGGAPPRLESRHDLRAHLSATARTSPLVWRLFGRNTSRPWDGTASGGVNRPMPPESSAPLTEDEKRTIIEWIDLGAR